MTPSPAACTQVTNPCRRPCASFPRREVLDLRGSGPRENCCCFQPAVASHTTNIHAHAYIHTHSTLGPIIIAHKSVSAFSLSCTTLVSRGTHGVFLLSSSGFPLLSFFLLCVAPAALSFCLLRVAPCAIPARKQKCACSAAPCPPANKNMLAQRSLARTPMIDGRTKRRAVRRHG